MDVETTGYVLRLCPFESLAFSGATLTEEDLETFVDVSRACFQTKKSIDIFTFRFVCLQCLENQTSILDATVKQREKFILSIDKVSQHEWEVTEK